MTRWIICAVLFGLLQGFISETEGQDIGLGRFDFENPSLAGWEGGGGFASVSAENPASGKWCLMFALNGKAGGQFFRRFTIPPIKDPNARMVRISFSIRSENFSSGTVSISLLKIFDSGREPEWFDWDKPVFAAVTTQREWTLFSAEGFLGPEVRNLTFYFNIGNTSKTGKVFVDNLNVDLLDRGLRFNLGWKDYIFPEESKTLDLIISSPEKLKSGQVALFNEENRNVGQIDLSRGKGTKKVLLPDRGYYLARIRGEYDDGIKLETSTPLAVVGPRIPDDQRMKSRFGMSGYDMQFIDAGARWDRRRGGLELDVLEKASKDGFKNPLPHSLYEVSGDRTSIYYLWPQPVWLQDRNVLTFPRRVSTSLGMYPMKDWEKFRKLVAFAVKNMSKKPLEYVEVANEPDCSWNGLWSGLVQYHKEMAQAVKSVSPTTKIIGPCLCTIKIKELKVLYSLGLFKYLDGLSIHAYVQSTPPEKEFIKLVHDLKTFMNSIGKKDMPIFFTEYGWSVPPGDWQKPVDPLTQARYCSRSLILLAAEEIDAIQWFCLRWADPNSSASGYGLLNWEWTPRPSYPAYAGTVRWLTNTTGPGRVFRITPTGYMVLFNRNGNTLAVVWDTEKKSSSFLPKHWKEARDMMGRPVKEPDLPTIGISPSPLFVEINDTGFYRQKEIKSIEIRQGKDALLPFTPVWTPEPLIVENNQLIVPADAAKGPYLLIGKVDKEWQAVTVNVIG